MQKIMLLMIGILLSLTLQTQAQQDRIDDDPVKPVLPTVPRLPNPPAPADIFPMDTGATAGQNKKAPKIRSTDVEAFNPTENISEDTPVAFPADI